MRKCFLGLGLFYGCCRRSLVLIMLTLSMVEIYVAFLVIVLFPTLGKLDHRDPFWNLERLIRFDVHIAVEVVIPSILECAIALRRGEHG